MIKFCGNCGTTITEKEIKEGHSVQSGNYVYCGRCAVKLGHVLNGGPLDVLDIEDTTDTQIVHPDHFKLDLPDNLFQGASTGDTTSLSARDMRRSGSDQKTRPVAPVGGKIDVVCPGCRAKLRVPVGTAPRTVKCPKCTKLFEVRPPGKSGTQAVNKATGAVKKLSGPARPAAAAAPARKAPEAGALEPLEQHPDPAADPALTALPGAVEAGGAAPAKPKTAATPTGGPSASASRRGGALSSRHRAKDQAGASDATAGAARPATGRGVLITVFFIFALAPFALFLIPQFTPALARLGAMVGTGLAGLGLPVPGTVPPPAVPEPPPAPPAAMPDAGVTPAPEAAGPPPVTEPVPAEPVPPPAEPVVVPPQQ